MKSPKDIYAALPSDQQLRYQYQLPFDEFHSPELTAWKLARAAIEHENLLVNQRLTWLLVSQAFLFSAFGLLFIAWAKGELTNVDANNSLPWLLIIVCVFSLYLCTTIQISLRRGFLALEGLGQHYETVQIANSFGKRSPPLHLWRPIPLILDAHCMPGGFFGLWLIILIFVTYSQFPGLMTQFQAHLYEIVQTLALVFFAGLAGYLIHWWRGRP